MYLKPEFKALLQSNDVPSALTILEVRESLKAPLNELKEVEEELRRLGELIKVMKTKRQRLQETINDHNIILSPARRLPRDVLHEIFLHCLPVHHNPVIKSSQAPLLLTQICSSWRAIALSSPRLWSKIHVPFPGDPGRADSGSQTITDETTLRTRHELFAGILRLRCDAVRTWLSRSGTCPLSLSVSYPGYFYGTEYSTVNELTQELFDIVLSFAERWSDVALSMHEGIFFNYMQNNTSTFPCLKSLKVHLHQGFFDLYDHPMLVRLLSAPGLRRIALRAVVATLQMPETFVQPNWIHITHITFTSETDDRYFLALLRQCPNLVVGKFQVVTSSRDRESEDSSGGSDKPDEEEVLLPRLESLAIDDFCTSQKMTATLNAIKAPALTRLSYQIFSDVDDPEPDAYFTPLPMPVLPLLENSTLIRDLSLGGSLSSKDVYKCFQPGAQITRIVFGKPLPANAPPIKPPLKPSDVVDLRILSGASHPVIPLPRLEFLEAHQLSRLTDEDLLEIITSRIEAFKRGETVALKSIKISFLRQIQNDISEEVSRLAREGGIEIKLALTYLTKQGINIKSLTQRLSPSFGLSLAQDVWSHDS